MTDCIFCKIVNKEIPGKIVYEDEHVLAFLDIKPVARGHTLVIPKKHATDIFELDDKSAEEILKVAKKVSTGILKSLGAAGINLLNANRKEAGQSVFHYHMHVIPRYTGDGMRVWPNSNYKESNLDEVADVIKKHI
ncbi:MAG: HIT family protein [Candidatus Micrarchaeota archaeon]|nr:HIT family protein [Candidatus Micrarchaeota archaeon]